jgi:NAD(P)-dependent dehydrogenase (short-subunit alcohol dehydrogenase family)
MTASPSVTRTPSTDPAATRVLDCRVGQGTADWRQGVEDTVLRLLVDLQDVATNGDVKAVTILLDGDDGSVGAGALHEAVRGVMWTAALELAPAGIRVNTVIADPDQADLSTTLDYVADADRAALLTGATLDLTHAVGTAPRSDAAVLVVGSAGALGFAAARELSQAGYRLLLTDLPGDALERNGKELGVPVVGLDVTDPDEVAKVAQRPEFEGGLRALVIHHGVAAAGSLDSLDPGVRDRAFRINASGVHYLIDALLPSLQKAHGSVVTLASQAGLAPEAGLAAYCASKFGAVGLSRAYSRSEAPHGVRFHTICPGPVDTPLLRDAFSTLAAEAGVDLDSYMEQRALDVPIQAFGVPSQIGAAARYLIELDATGINLPLAGGIALT